MKKNLLNLKKITLTFGLAAASLAAPFAHADSAHLFGFQQGNLTKDGVVYGSGAGYSGVLDGHIVDNTTNTALSTTYTMTIGNQFFGNQNGRQFVGLFAYDLSELNSFIAANNTVTSTAMVESVSFKLVSTGGTVAGSTGTINLYETDPFTSAATWNSTNGVKGANNWTTPFQTGFGVQTNSTFTGGGSSNSVALGVSSNAVNISSASVLGGVAVIWTNSASFTVAISNALARADKKLYIAAARPTFVNADSRLFVSTSTTNIVAQRPQLFVTVTVIGAPPVSSDLKWVGNLSGTWDTSTLNWNDGVGAVAYANAKNVTFDDSLSTSPLNNNIALSSTFSPSNIVANHTTYNYSLTGGGLTGNMNFTKQGGGTFSLGMSNAYTGITTISGGILVAADANALGSTAGGTIIASGASLALSNGITLAGEPITINGTGAGNFGALRTVDAVNPVTVAAPITVGNNGARIQTSLAGSQLILTGPITDNGSNFLLNLNAGQANSTLRVNTAGNTGISNVTVYSFLPPPSGGSIIFGANHAFPSALVNFGGGLFDLNGTDQTFAGLGQGFLPLTGLVTNSSSTPATLTINWSRANSTNITSTIGGNINIVKNGSGSQVFGGGTNTVFHSYSGTTTVNEGFLSLSCNMSAVTNDFIVNNGATLRGSAIIGGNVIINSGGTYYPGSASNNIGTAYLQKNLTLNSGSTVIATINPDLVGSNSVINVNGTLTYGGTLVIYSIGHTNALQAGQTFRIFPPGGVGSFAATNFNSIESQSGVSVSFADGLVTVAAAPAPTLTVTPQGGGAMQIARSSSFFKLQYQTNSLVSGLSDSWVDFLPAMTNLQVSVTVTNDPAIPSTFFRLAPKL